MYKIMITQDELADIYEDIVVQHNAQRSFLAKQQCAMVPVPVSVARCEFKKYCADPNGEYEFRPFVYMLIVFDKKPSFNLPLLNVVGLFEVREDWNRTPKPGYQYLVKEIVLFEKSLSKTELNFAMQSVVLFLRKGSNYLYPTTKVKLVLKTPLKERADSIIYKSKITPPKYVLDLVTLEDDSNALVSELNQKWEYYKRNESRWWAMLDLNATNLTGLPVPALHDICSLLGCKDYTAIGDIKETILAICKFLAGRNGAVLISKNDGLPYAVIVQNYDNEGNVFIDKLACKESLKKTGKPAEIVKTIIDNTPKSNFVQVEDVDNELKKSAEQNPLNDLFTKVEPYEYAYNTTVTSDEINKSRLSES